MATLDIRPFPPSATPEPVREPTGRDRRRHPRLVAVRAAKVFLPTALRYAPGETADISAGGALLRVDRARLLRPGDRLDLVFADPAQPAAVIESKTMTSARVVRVTPIDHFHQAVAVEFDEPAAEAALAAA